MLEQVYDAEAHQFQLCQGQECVRYRVLALVKQTGLFHFIGP